MCLHVSLTFNNVNKTINININKTSLCISSTNRNIVKCHLCRKGLFVTLYVRWREFVKTMDYHFPVKKGLSVKNGLLVSRKKINYRLNGSCGQPVVLFAFLNPRLCSTSFAVHLLLIPVVDICCSHLLTSVADICSNLLFTSTAQR